MTQVSQMTADQRKARLKAVFDRVVARNGDAIRKLAAAEHEVHEELLQRNLTYIKRVNGEGLRELAQS